LTAYILTEAAEDDLRSIIRYTREQWGDVQPRKYIAARIMLILDFCLG